MNKRELTDAVAQRTGTTKQAASAIVDAFFDVIQDAVAGGEKVTIPGFGSFERAERPARDGFNNLTGKPFSVPATFVPKFKAGATFKDAVAGADRPAA